MFFRIRFLRFSANYNPCLQRANLGTGQQSCKLASTIGNKQSWTLDKRVSLARACEQDRTVRPTTKRHWSHRQLAMMASNFLKKKNLIQTRLKGHHDPSEAWSRIINHHLFCRRPTFNIIMIKFKVSFYLQNSAHTAAMMIKTHTWIKTNKTFFQL